VSLNEHVSFDKKSCANHIFRIDDLAFKLIKKLQILPHFWKSQKSIHNGTAVMCQYHTHTHTQPF